MIALKLSLVCLYLPHFSSFLLLVFNLSSISHFLSNNFNDCHLPNLDYEFVRCICIGYNLNQQCGKHLV